MPNAPSPDMPLWRATRWLADPGGDVPPAIRVSLVNGLYGTLPIFAGGVINTIAVAALMAHRFPLPGFFLWLVLEVSICLTRLAILLRARAVRFQGIERLTDIYIGLGVLWAASVGYGTFICIASGDWVAAALAFLSAAAMVGGICFRNFGAPRLVAVMILLSLGPSVVASLMSGETILYITAFQIPFYLYAMTVAAFRLNRILISTMRAEQESDYRARHDFLTGLLNRVGLERQLSEGPGQGATIAFFYLDLDGFKAVNDRLGHGAGDALLHMVGERLQSLCGPGSIAARIGGDEFVMAFNGNGREEAVALGERILAAVGGEPYPVGREDVVIGVSIGIAFGPDHGSTLPELLSAADKALYQAKSRGRNGCAIAPSLQPPSLRLVARTG